MIGLVFSVVKEMQLVCPIRRHRMPFSPSFSDVGVALLAKVAPARFLHCSTNFLGGGYLSSMFYLNILFLINSYVVVLASSDDPWLNQVHYDVTQWLFLSFLIPLSLGIHKGRVPGLPPPQHHKYQNL